MKKNILFTLCSVALVLFMAIPASADIWGTNFGLDLSSIITGSRTTDNADELIGTGNWASNFDIAWQITPPESGSTLWNYQYTITGPTAAISHIIMSFTDPIEMSELMYEGSGDVEFDSAWGQSPGNPNMPGSIYGFKFEDFEDDVSGGGGLFSYVLEFEIGRSPVWGDFYAKGGGGPQLADAWNVGLDPNFLGDRDAQSTYIVRPNGQVPIPGAVWLLGSGLLGLMGLRAYRRK